MGRLLTVHCYMEHACFKGYTFKIISVFASHFGHVACVTIMDLIMCVGH
jgi:hypothetical protein